MCATCGCGQDDVRISSVPAHSRQHEHPHEHPHQHPHEHPHSQAPATTTLLVEEQILAKNDGLASDNRSWLAERGIAAVNVMSSPGSGKTSLLERTIRETGQRREICVIEGDQETLLDSARILEAGARAIQVNTGAGCHLDAAMVRGALEQLGPPAGSLLMVENVGNLVCPALFDLGEQGKVVVISVTEGDDKPLKYPHMFAAASLVVINKIDLLPYVDFDVEACAAQARALNPTVEVIALSVTSGAGMDAWYDWLEAL